jgi:mRNA interferase RelE/StbE
LKYSEKFARRFLRSYKRLHPNQLRAVHESLDQILRGPAIGEPKKEDLKELFVYKFLLIEENFLIAYTINDLTKEVTFEAVGPDENFYRDLKR